MHKPEKTSNEIGLSLSEKININRFLSTSPVITPNDSTRPTFASEKCMFFKYTGIMGKISAQLAPLIINAINKTKSVLLRKWKNEADFLVGFLANGVSFSGVFNEGMAIMAINTMAPLNNKAER